MTTTKLHPVAILVWSIFVAAVFYAEWADPNMASTGLWLTLLGYFVFWEAVGGIRTKRGDMFSEFLWTFSSGKWGAQAFTGSFGAYFAARLYMLMAPGEWPMPPGHLPRAVLIVGFAVWLVVHLVTEGRKA